MTSMNYNTNVLTLLVEMTSNPLDTKSTTVSALANSELVCRQVLPYWNKDNSVDNRHMYMLCNNDTGYISISWAVLTSKGYFANISTHYNVSEQIIYQLTNTLKCTNPRHNKKKDHAEVHAQQKYHTSNHELTIPVLSLFIAQSCMWQLVT